MTTFRSSEYNWEPFVQGTDWIRELEFSTDTGIIPLTDYKARLTIKDFRDPTGVTILDICSTASSTGGSSVAVTATGGKVTISLTDSDTALFTWTQAEYDLKLTGAPADGSLETVPLFGKFTIIKNVVP